ARATSALRISPSPVGIATSTYGFASERSRPGRIPTVWPPADFAPRQAASITPPRPPVTRTAPSSAKRLPAASASAICSAEASLAPITATETGGSAKLGPEALAPARVTRLPAELPLGLGVRDRLQAGREAR